MRGVLNRPDAQVVFVDTPGIHKPRTLLGERLNDTAASALADVDVVVFVIDATAPLGKGDRFVAGLPPGVRPVRDQQDRRRPPAATLAQLAAAGRARLRRVLPGLGVHRRGRATRWWTPSWPACRRALSSTPTTW